MGITIDWKRVVATWAASGRTTNTIAVYLYWARRFETMCASLGLDVVATLTLGKVLEVVETDPPRRSRRSIGQNRISAVRALSYALGQLGHRVPAWSTPRARMQLDSLLDLYVDHRVRTRGVVETTVRRDARCAARLRVFLRSRRRSLISMRIVDIDAFVALRARLVTAKTLSGECSALRSFLRFVHMRGITRSDLAIHVASPRVRSIDRPRRAVPWITVRRILRAIDAGTRLGRRDRALFLMMASYGMGAAEIIALRLDDIDWRERRFRVSRSKTDVTTELPLLAPVARALASYLRHGRPAHAGTRAVFVSDHLPHGPLSGSTTIRHRLALYAARAGIHEGYLGTHLFRHSHATREIELGRSAKVVGDILGHRRPESTSVYTRSALPRLRTMALPVPR